MALDPVVLLSREERKYFKESFSVQQQKFGSNLMSSNMEMTQRTIYNTIKRPRWGEEEWEKATSTLKKNLEDMPLSKKKIKIKSENNKQV